MLRLERGRRRPDQQCALARRPAGRPAARSRAVAGLRSAADDVLRRHDDRRAGQGRDGRPRRAGRDRDERRAAAGRARLPGADRGARSVRLRVGVQVGRRHRGDHVRRPAGVLDRWRLGAAERDQARVAYRHAALGQAGAGRPSGRGRRASPGTSTSACLSRRACRSTTDRGCRRGSPRCPRRTPGGSGCVSWTPPQAGQLHAAGARDRRATARRRSSSTRDAFPSGATGLHTITVTLPADHSTVDGDVSPAVQAPVPTGGQATARPRSSEPPFDPTSWSGALIVMAVFAAVLWAIQIANAHHGYAYNRFGLKPRELDGLWGVLHAAVPARELRAPAVQHRPAARHRLGADAVRDAGVGLRHRDRDRARRSRDLAGRAVQHDDRRRERAGLRLARLPARARVLHPPAEVDLHRGRAAAVLRHAARQPAADRRTRRCPGSRTSAGSWPAIFVGWLLHPRKGVPHEPAARP